MMDTVLTFYLGEVLCGIDIAYAKEINRKVEYTDVIGEDARVLGLLNLRGRVITLVDLAYMVGLTQRTEGRKYCVILKENKAGGDAIGFFTDKVGEVLTVTPDMFEAPPVNGQGIDTGLAELVLKLPDKMVLLFDVYKLLESG